MALLPPRHRAEPGHAESLAQAAVAVVVALVLSQVVRGVTIELNHSLGHVWPFSLDHCHSPATLGCDSEMRGAARLRQPARQVAL